MYQDLPSAPELFAFLKSSVDLSGEASTQREEVIQKLQCAINSVGVFRKECIHVLEHCRNQSIEDRCAFDLQYPHAFRHLSQNSTKTTQ